MSVDLLPECRQVKDHTPRNMVQSAMGMQVPIYCANCGKPGGHCPAENMTFFFYLCNPCFERYGHQTLLKWMPDQVFFEKMKLEQEASYGRYLTELEIAKVVEEDASPLATLIKERLKEERK